MMSLMRSPQAYFSKGAEPERPPEAEAKM